MVVKCHVWRLYQKSHDIYGALASHLLFSGGVQYRILEISTLREKN